MDNKTTALETAFGDFGQSVKVVSVRRGPLVSTYEIQIGRGVKSSRITGLASDVGRLLGVQGVRISPIMGRSTLAVEVPNDVRETIDLQKLFASEQFKSSTALLPIVLGLAITGEVAIADLATMPHLLVAGTTGSGKSVGVNGMILSLLAKFTPEECKFLFIDPKMLELSVYDGIPHLLRPTVTDPKEAIAALQEVVEEMDNRYRVMADAKVRNIANYNERFAEKLPYIVVVIDEFADLSATAGKALEALAQRIAQKARAAGIHLIMATQRPSVDVVTGVLKANFPTRISYKVASGFDSRTILGEEGAESLLGKGDMLLMEGSQTRRIHGAFVSDDAVESMVAPLRDNVGTATVKVTQAAPAAPVKEPTLQERATALFAEKPLRIPTIGWLINDLDITAGEAEGVLKAMGYWKGLRAFA